MAEEDRKNHLAVFSAVLAVLAALGLIVYSNIPLKGLRPSSPEIYEPPPKVRARLWQDPFLAVVEYVKATKRTESPPKGFCILSDQHPSVFDNDLQKNIEKRAAQGRITVLAVMVEGGPYADNMEVRIRNRYAVLSGLNQANLKPEDAEHLWYTGIEEETPSGPRSVSLSNILPYEWLKKRDEGEFVLLLWLNDDLFRDAPCDRLANLIKFIQGHYNTPFLWHRHPLPFKIIGPATSENLVEMVQKGKSNVVLKDVEIYSPLATVADWILHSRPAGKEGKDDSQTTPNQTSTSNNKPDTINRPPDIIRTTATDEDLAELLVEELGNRGLDILAEEKNHLPPEQKHRDHLVLVAEWDTFYGRMFPRTFKKIFEERLGQEDKLEEWVHEFTYLRGLDGMLPGEKERDGKDKSKNQTDRQAAEELLITEEPAGKTQYDYLRRLADYLRRLDQDLHRQDKGSIRAIGVLGSDFHDKYLILQALGQCFPEAIFFTTDLDARLTHPSYNKWTRNLLVASPFDLQLRADLQGPVPPFRGSYQASVYWATLSVFRSSLQIEDFFYPPRPRLFEIGRNSALDITPDKPQIASITDSGEVRLKYDTGFNPVNRSFPPPTDLPRMSLLHFLVFLLFLSCLLFISSRYFNLGVRRLGDYLGRYLPLTLPVGLVMLWLAFIIYRTVIPNPAEEPFSWSEGVSTWPTFLIRFLAIALSWSFFYVSQKSLQDNCKDIEMDYCLPTELRPYRSRHNSPGISPKSWLDYWKDRISYNWMPQYSGGAVGMDSLWQEYLLRQSWGYRWRRLLVLLVIYAIVCFSVIWTEPPRFPVRGAGSIIINYVTLVLCVFSFLILTLFVFDATKLCWRFISLIRKLGPSWSEATLRGSGWKSDWPEKLEEGLGFWLLIRLIAQHTEVVGRLIFYPFIVWFLIFVSRLHYFDNWRMHLGLALVISLGAVYAWCSAVILRRSAEKFRKVAVARLSQEVIEARMDAAISPEGRGYLEAVLRDVETIRRGAFAPYLQNPVLQTLLVPFGGLGGLQLLDLLSKIK
jgi:hypothetical protein